MDANDHGLQELSDPELQAIEHVVQGLVHREMATLEAIGAYARGSDPYVWTRNYGRWGEVDLVVPPGSPSEWEGIVIRSESAPTWAGVVVDMWTQQEGRSDLSLELDLTTEQDGTVTVLFCGLHVM